MKSNYKRLGDYIRQVDVRNRGIITNNLLGINIDKFFMPSVANVIGTDLSNYKLIKNNQFACNPMHVGRDERIPVALYLEKSEAIVSPAYFVFEIIKDELLSQYLMLWFRRPEFDRECWFYTDASVRGGITWEDFCEMRIPVPPMEEQEKIVDAYQTIEHRITLKKKINENLEAQALCLYSNLVNGIEPNTPMSEIYKFQYGKGNNNPDNGGVYPIYGSNGVIGGYDTFNNEDAPVIGHIGSCGSLIFAFGKHFVTYNGIMCNCIDPIYKWFGYLTLKKQNLQEQVRGSTQPFISYDMLYEICVPLPNREQILKFNCIIDPLLNSIRKIIVETRLLKYVESLLLQKIVNV